MKCKCQDCDLQHCKECGSHILDTSGETCENCQLDNIAAATQTIIAGFDGNYEEAAKFWGW